MVNKLFAGVSLDYARFMDKQIKKLFPMGCEDHKQFIANHEIHLRNYPTDGTSELWIDDKKVGTFSQQFQNHRFIFEFTK